MKPLMVAVAAVFAAGMFLSPGNESHKMFSAYCRSAGSATVEVDDQSFNVECPSAGWFPLRVTMNSDGESVSVVKGNGQ